MRTIEVYDIEAEDLEQLADKYDETVAVVVEALMDAVRDNGINIKDYL